MGKRQAFFARALLLTMGQAAPVAWDRPSRCPSRDGTGTAVVTLTRTPPTEPLRPRQVRLNIVRAAGTVALVAFLATLARLALPPASAIPPVPAFALLALALVLATLLWTLPWARFPEVALVPFTLLGSGAVLALQAYAGPQAAPALPLLWTAFAALAHRWRLGLPVAAALALGGPLLALARRDGAEALFQSLVLLPFLLLVYLVTERIVANLATLRAAVTDARGAAARLAAIHDFAILLGRERDLDRLLAALVEGLAARFGYRLVSAFLLVDGRLRLRAQVGYTTPIAELALGEGIAGLVAREGRPLLVRDGRTHPHYLAAEPGLASQASVPLVAGGRVLGVLNLEGIPHELTEDDLQLLETLAAPVAVAIENATLLARLEDQALRDPLTYLLNRRGILARLEAALARGQGAERRATDPAPVTILVVDLNNFKAVNDRYGHPVGDALLTELAGLLAGSVRAEDAVGRLGGDEFLVVMPGADPTAATGVVERLRAAIAGYAFPLLPGSGDEPPPAVGYSLGVATAPHDGRDAQALLAVADHAMYQAKRSGVAPIRFLARPPDDRSA